MRKTLSCILILLVVFMALSPLSFAAAEEDASPTPIHHSQLVEGTYDITVTSSSSMFNIVKAQLIVEEEGMYCIMTLSGKGYEKLYMGTEAEALLSSEAEQAYFIEDGDGMYTYKVPVEVLDAEVFCSAWSFKKEKWYERTVVFESTLLDESAFAVVEPEGMSSGKKVGIGVGLGIAAGLWLFLRYRKR